MAQTGNIYKDRKIKQCGKRPTAYGRGSFLLFDKIYEVCYTMGMVKYLDVRVKCVYAFLRVN